MPPNDCPRLADVEKGGRWRRWAVCPYSSVAVGGRLVPGLVPANRLGAAAKAASARYAQFPGLLSPEVYFGLTMPLVGYGAHPPQSALSEQLLFCLSLLCHIVSSTRFPSYIPSHSRRPLKYFHKKPPRVSQPLCTIRDNSNLPSSPALYQHIRESRFISSTNSPYAECVGPPPLIGVAASRRASWLAGGVSAIVVKKAVGAR